MRKKRMVLMLAVCAAAVIALTVCAAFFFDSAEDEQALYEADERMIQQEQEAFDELKAIALRPVPLTPSNVENGGEAPSVWLDIDFDALLAMNPDTVGWIHIPDTPVSYPVVKGKNNSEYLKKNFEGKSSASGTPYMSSGNHVNPLDMNTVIYGHNMGQNKTTMFSMLRMFQEQEYADAHSYIEFDTHYGSGRWQVVAAVYLNSDVDSAVLKLLSKSDFTDDEWLELQAFIQNQTLIEPKELSRSDKLLTLITCDRTKYGADGRMVVIARLIDGSLIND